jgi:hypothetical protein
VRVARNVERLVARDPREPLPAQPLEIDVHRLGAMALDPAAARRELEIARAQPGDREAHAVARADLAGELEIAGLVRARAVLERAHERVRLRPRREQRIEIEPVDAAVLHRELERAVPSFRCMPNARGLFFEIAPEVCHVGRRKPPSGGARSVPPVTPRRGPRSRAGPEQAERRVAEIDPRRLEQRRSVVAEHDARMDEPHLMQRIAADVGELDPHVTARRERVVEEQRQLVRGELGAVHVVEHHRHDGEHDEPHEHRDAEQHELPHRPPHGRRNVLDRLLDLVTDLLDETVVLVGRRVATGRIEIRIRGRLGHGVRTTARSRTGCAGRDRDRRSDRAGWPSSRRSAADRSGD